MRFSQSFRGKLLIVGTVLLSILPFLDRAVFLDEHLLLFLARSAYGNGPGAYQDISTTFFGITLPNLSSHTHPPVVEYCLAVLYWFFGEFDEASFRFFFSVFPAAAIIAFYDLARRFTRNPAIVTVLFASSPAFFVMAPTLMADIPALSFFLTGLALYFRNQIGWATLLFAAGLGTLYQTALPFSALLVWTIFVRRPLREQAVLALAPLPLALWLIWTATYFEHVPLLETVRYLLSHSSVTHNLSALPSFIGGTVVFPWLFLPLVKISRKALIAGVAVSVSVGLSMFTPWDSSIYQVYYVLMAASGLVLLLVFAVKIALDRTEHTMFFVLWLFSTFIFFLLAAEMIAARYLLLLMPPVYLVCFREIRNRTAAAVVAMTLMLSLSLALADYRLSGAYRSWVSRVVPDLQVNGFQVWSGAESGLRFYLSENGIQTLSATDLRPAGGDLIVRQKLFEYGLAKDLEQLLIVIHQEQLADPFPVRTLSAAAHAGFHDSHIGLMPYVVSHTPLDSVSILQVSPLVRMLPQVVPPDFSSVPVWSPEGVLLKQVKDEMEFPVRIPAGSVVRYDLSGSARLVVTPDALRLIKLQRDPVLWKNLRIVPAQFDNPASR
ncbi:MAG: hypothetical protein HY646_08295 [Acidobacteria bacterium]|nr:hypothetical protein [Acidobacteriota bacterium]